MELYLMDKGIILENFDANSHILTIERTNWFLKERISCVLWMDMLFNKFGTKIFLIEVVNTVTILVNSIPKKGGVHQVMSLQNILT